MSRRFSISLLMVTLCASVVMADRRPNVLIIVGDDHRNDAIGVYGNQLVRTPNLDRLSIAGIRFDRAYANSPMCTSSRQSFLTGRYPHTLGVTLLKHCLQEEACTLADRLRSKGYRTGAFGKMHFNSPLRHGFEIHRTPREFWQRFGERTGPALPEGLEVLPAWRPFADPARIWLNGFYRPMGRYDDEMPDTWYAREAIAFMKKHREEPFFVQVGFHEPHSPFWFPVELANTLKPGEMKVPAIGPEDYGQIPRIFGDLEDRDKQGIIASYHTSVAFLDLNVGRLLGSLDELGLGKDTLVIYLGDHGYHLGEHGRFEKHCFYERAVRAPLLMRFPSRIRAGSSSASLVEFVDIVPTVLDYLGVSAEEGDPRTRLEGHSLRPLIEGRVEGIRDAVFSEYQHTESAMVRTDRYKLIYNTSRAVTDWYKPMEPPRGRGIRLFDVRTDPEELHNIADVPANAAVVSALLDRLAGWYRDFRPCGEEVPAGLTDAADLLDWAIPPRAAVEPARR